MRSDTTIDPDRTHHEGGSSPRRRPALVLLFSREEPQRTGEVWMVPRRGPRLLGRGAARDDDPHPRGEWVRQRPARNHPQPPLSASALSRRQLVVSPHPDGVKVVNVGRRGLTVDGARCDEAVVTTGQVLALDDELVLLVGSRPVVFPALRAWPDPLEVPFGQADPFGMVGESEAMWALRDTLAFAAGRPLHVLLHGPTGAGKELAARALHGLGDISSPLVSRNAATLPEGLIDAELFGNRAQYPNPGMAARAGLVGAADGGSLFLDEIGELSESAQAHLLRVLDDGEYQRLGESEVRTSRFRLIGATNRPLDQLKHDLLARLTLRIPLPPLRERVEDLPLLARHLVQRAVEEDARLRAQFVDEGGVPRLSPELLSTLVRRPFPHGVRELVTLLWSCMQSSTGDWVTPPHEVLRTSPASPTGDAAIDPDSLTVDTIRAALAQHDWVVARSWAPLGLKSRHALNRLIKKHGIVRPS